MSHPDCSLASLPPQVLSACKRLVQYIHEAGLQAGDRLPPQAELRELLGRNNYTLGAAMQTLVNRGVLSRKTRTGTVIVDLEAIGPLPWSVGVATIEAPLVGEMSVFANLALRVQTRLNALGCRCIAYSSACRLPPDRLDQFGLLPSDLASGLLDGLVLLTALDANEWDALRRRRLPVVHLPFWSQAPGGVILDQRHFVREAVCRLHGAGCRSFGVASVEPPDTHPDWRVGLAEGLAANGLPATAGQWLDGRFAIAGGERLARQLLALPAAKRPDGLIVPDDYLALGLTNVLATAERYRPRVAVLVHAQLPLRYPLPVDACAVDLEALVQRLVSMLHDHLHRPSLPDRLDRVAGRFGALSPSATLHPQPIEVSG